jgi:hypothetical protein
MRIITWPKALHTGVAFTASRVVSAAFPCYLSLMHDWKGSTGARLTTTAEFAALHDHARLPSRFFGRLVADGLLIDGA